jgi:hypothetical protein
MAWPVKRGKCFKSKDPFPLGIKNNVEEFFIKYLLYAGPCEALCVPSLQMNTLVYRSGMPQKGDGWCWKNSKQSRPHSRCFFPRNFSSGGSLVSLTQNKIDPKEQLCDIISDQELCSIGFPLSHKPSLQVGIRTPARSVFSSPSFGLTSSHHSGLHSNVSAQRWHPDTLIYNVPSPLSPITPFIFPLALISARNYIPVVPHVLCHPVRMQIVVTILLTSWFSALITVSDIEQTLPFA